MHVVSRKRLREAATKHRELVEPLELWFKRAKRAQWGSIADVRSDFPTADAVGRCTVFNVKGNKYRLIADIRYGWGKVFIRKVLTHAEYDKGEWKNDC